MKLINTLYETAVDLYTETTYRYIGKEGIRFQIDLISIHRRLKEINIFI